MLLIMTTLVLAVMVDAYLRSNQTFDDVRFNNIVTPIAAIVSVILFVYLTREQSRIQESSNQKQNLDERFEQLRNELQKSITNKVLMATGVPTGRQPYKFPDINSMNCFDTINSTLDRISANADFVADHTDFLNNRDIKLSHQYLGSRSYFMDLNFVLAFAAFPTYRFHLIENFIDEINDSRLLAADIAHFKRKVESTFLEDYFNLVMHRGSFELPDFHNTNSNEIPWRSYRAAGFDRYFVDFRKKLSV